MSAHASSLISDSFLGQQPEGSENLFELFCLALTALGAVLGLSLLYPVFSLLAHGSSAFGFMALLTVPLGLIVTGATISFTLMCNERTRQQ